MSGPIRHEHRHQAPLYAPYTERRTTVEGQKRSITTQLKRPHLTCHKIAEIWRQIFNLGLEPNEYHYTAAFQALAKTDANETIRAWKIFWLEAEMEHFLEYKSIFSYNVLMECYTDLHDFESAFKVLQKITASDLKVNHMTYNIALKFYAAIGKMDMVEQIYTYLQKESICTETTLEIAKHLKLA